jgi:hypothetical protein
MGILEKFFPAKTTITSATIRAEIDYSEAEITRLNAEIGPKLAAIATMNDSEHVKIEADIAATKRAIARLDARIAHLNDELPAVLAAEEAATKAEADAALIERAEAARKANTIESKKLLTEFDKLAAQMGGVLDKLKLIKAETEAVNAALRSNPAAEMVQSYEDIYRAIPGTQATEQRARVPHWVYRDAPPRPDEVYPGETEEALRAAIDSAGNPIKPAGVRYGRFGQIITPTLEQREIVVARSPARPPRYEHSLEDVRLPAGFAGGKWHWPRS